VPHWPPEGEPLPYFGTSPAARAPAHVAALDGLRGFAVLLVFCVHAAGNAAAVVAGIDLGHACPHGRSARCSGCSDPTTVYSCSSSCRVT